MDRGAAEDARQLTLFDRGPLATGGSRGTLALEGRCVAYRFERRARRTIALRVDAEGLAICAPLRAPWREIEAFARAKAHWIFAKLDAWAVMARTARRMSGRSGELLPYLGRDLVLELRAGPHAVTLSDLRLEITLPVPERDAEVRALLVAWLRKQAQEWLTPRVAHYADRLRLPAPPVTVSNARAQWGLCTAARRIRLAWRLMHLAPDLADYVVAHEVAHLVELNHSKRFWRIVQTLYPDWRAARAHLKRASVALPEL